MLNVNEQRKVLLSQLGLRQGINGPHAARTMMLEELRLLLAHVPASASRQGYATAVTTDNVLGKPTKKARELSLTHLSTLYGLDPSNPIFRALRRLWALDEAAQPMLALSVALARDPLLRGSQPFFLAQTPGTVVSRVAVEELLSSSYPGRFSTAS